MSGILSSFSSKKAGSLIFKEIFFKNPVGMCVITHPDFQIRLLNESFAEIFGFDKEYLSGKLFAEVWEKNSFRDEFFTILRTEGIVNDFRASFVILGGKETDILFSAARIDDEDFLICARLFPDD